MHRLDTDLSQSLSQSSPTESRVEALEAQLARAHEHIAELEARDSLKTQFLANISHDLRTPLTAVITHAEILRDGILGSVQVDAVEIPFDPVAIDDGAGRRFLDEDAGVHLFEIPARTADRQPAHRGQRR